MKPVFIIVAALLAASAGWAQHAHQTDMPVETGQSQFAAIAEIVALLRDDAETDWTQVNIAALRAHLIDMDNVTTKAAVERSIDGLSVTFSVTGDAVVAGSIKRMVLAHSPMLQQTSGWSVGAKPQEGGAEMTVTVKSAASLDQVAGLGFFGLLSVGAHHQRHHLLIAKGQSPH